MCVRLAAACCAAMPPARGEHSALRDAARVAKRGAGSSVCAVIAAAPRSCWGGRRTATGFRRELRARGPDEALLEVLLPVGPLLGTALLVLLVPGLVDALLLADMIAVVVVGVDVGSKIAGGTPWLSLGSQAAAESRALYKCMATRTGGTQSGIIDRTIGLLSMQVFHQAKIVVCIKLCCSLLIDVACGVMDCRCHHLSLAGSPPVSKSHMGTCTGSGLTQQKANQSQTMLSLHIAGRELWNQDSEGLFASDLTGLHWHV